MQGIRDSEDHEGTDSSGAGEARWVLDRPEGAVRQLAELTYLIHHGECVARAYGAHREGNHVTFDLLLWSPSVALRLLHGMTVPQVAGFLLMGGKHRPAWHPLPGVEQAVLAHP